ncbi:MAG: hypothetical protein CFK52_12610 [Chloracidobacterium sp. CP2_5A]|nr:MAG: hypothetical protein CFK52_12610 [Chloracidobacterium sp. CP2_5A]
MGYIRAFVATSLLGGLAVAQSSPSLPATHLKPKTVTAFKNGLAFVIRQGQAESQGGSGYLTRVPPAALGTLWVAPLDANVTLDELVATRISATYRAETRSATSIGDLLRANVGKRATLLLASGKEVSGVIRAFGPGSPTASALLYLEGDAANPGYTPFQPGDVKQVAFYELPASAVQTLQPEGDATEGKQLALRFRVKGATGPVNLTMGYLQSGLGWTPAYRITLEDDKTATIAMQALMINDAEDIENAEVFFVVGFPNFAFSRVLSPLALQQSLAAFLSSLARLPISGGENALSNAVLSQRAAPYRPEAADDAGTINGLLEGAAQSEEDLFLYGRQNVTLAKGERGAYNVFSGRVGYEHVYEWEIPAAPPVTVDSRRVTAPTETEPEKIWHTLRLTNSLKFPWTTAPALAMSADNKPLAQETLLYTPVGATTSLRLTLATDIRAQQSEQEAERKNDAVMINRSAYSAVAVNGALTLRNYKSKEVRLVVRKSVIGEVLSASHNGKAERTAEAVQSVNPISKIAWDFSLKAGETVTLTYRYKVLVN